MIVDILVATRKKTITEKVIVHEILSHLGSSLYGYLIYLENAYRIEDTATFTMYRNEVFDMRTKYDNGEVTLVAVGACIKKLAEKLMERYNDLCAGGVGGKYTWEAAFLQSPANEFANTAYYFTYYGEQ
jgi:hypothetical protein